MSSWNIVVVVCNLAVLWMVALLYWQSLKNLEEASREWKDALEVREEGLEALKIGQGYLAEAQKLLAEVRKEM